jgi:hypothetical protein
MSENNNKFIEASRKKLRFTTTKGQLSVEELWDLSLQSLDAIAKAVNKQLKASEEESFIPTASKRKDSDAELALDILKYIIQVKVEERDAEKARAEKREKAARLKELLAQKKDAELTGKSAEELEKMLAELGGE